MYIHYSHYSRRCHFIKGVYNFKSKLISFNKKKTSLRVVGKWVATQNL